MYDFFFILRKKNTFIVVSRKTYFLRMYFCGAWKSQYVSIAKKPDTCIFCLLVYKWSTLKCLDRLFFLHNLLQIIMQLYEYSIFSKTKNIKHTTCSIYKQKGWKIYVLVLMNINLLRNKPFQFLSLSYLYFFIFFYTSLFIWCKLFALGFCVLYWMYVCNTNEFIL